MGVGGDHERRTQRVDIPKHMHGRGPSVFAVFYLYPRKSLEKALFSKVTLFITKA